MHDARVPLNRVCLQGLHVRLLAILRDCLFAFVIACVLCIRGVSLGVGTSFGGRHPLPQGIVPAESSLHARTAALPRLEFSVDHLALLWCRQLVSLVANSLTALLERCMVEHKVSVGVPCG